MTNHSTLYSQLEAVMAINLGLQTGFFPPPLRDWALSPDALLVIMEMLREAKPRVIVECGSGSSTIYIAQMYKSLGLDMPRYIALEHDAEYFERTRLGLTSRGLGDAVELVHAPLVPVTLADGTNTTWYDVSSIKFGRKPIDFLLIDGPPTGDDVHTRGAFASVLGKRMAKDCAIFLDDYRRTTEVRVCESLEAMGAAHRVREYLNLEKGAAILTVGPVTDPALTATFRASPTSLTPLNGVLDETFKDGLSHWRVVRGEAAEAADPEPDMPTPSPRFKTSTVLRSDAIFKHLHGQGYALTLDFDPGSQTYRGMQIGLELLDGAGELLDTINSHSFTPSIREEVAVAKTDDTPADIAEAAQDVDTIEDIEAKTDSKASDAKASDAKVSGKKDGPKKEAKTSTDGKTIEPPESKADKKEKPEVSTLRSERVEISVAKIAQFESQGLASVRPVIGIYAPTDMALCGMTINRVERPKNAT